MQKRVLWSTVTVLVILGWLISGMGEQGPAPRGELHGEPS